MRDDVLVGRELGGFKIEAPIGRGGMSRVYRATQPSVGRMIALKVLSSEWVENDEFRQRFLAEARLAATIEHPNILPIYDAGETDGHLYIAMRLVDGTDLRRLLERDGRLTLERTLTLIEAAAAALDAAHDRGLVHRDVKPANLLLAGEHLYLSDFGIAKIAAARREFTRTGMFVGTLDYASPEQIRNEELDGRADLYSLGCVLFHCLAGAPPYDRPSEYGTMQAHMYDPPPSLHAKRSELPRAIDDVIATVLAKQKDERFRTGRHLSQALREVQVGTERPQFSSPRSSPIVAPTVLAMPKAGATAAAGAHVPSARLMQPPTMREAVGIGVQARSTTALPRLPSLGRLSAGDSGVVAIGFALAALALFLPTWATAWSTGGVQTRFIGDPAPDTWLRLLTLIGCAAGIAGIRTNTLVSWLGWIAVASVTFLYSGLPLLRNALIVPAPSFVLEMGYWISIVGIFLGMFGLLGVQRFWLRVACIGVGLCALSLVIPTWALLIGPSGQSLAFRAIRAFDAPNGAWAGVCLAAFGLMCVGLALRLFSASGTRFVIRVTATVVTWISAAVGWIAVLWALGFDRSIRSAELGPGYFLFAEGYWIAVIGLTLVTAGLVLEVSTSERPRPGRWNTVARMIAPSHSGPTSG